MKRCQKCSRTFPDENQKFCTFDGGLLLADQPTFDPNRTVLAPQMPSLPPVPPPPPPALPPPPKPSAPERDMSETIVAYRPSTVPEPTPAAETTALNANQTTADLPPSQGSPPVAQTSRDLVAPTAPPATGGQTSSDLTLPYSGETLAVLPPAPKAPVSTPPPSAPRVQPPPPPVVQPPPPPVVQPPPPPVQPPPPPAQPPPPPAQQAAPETLPQPTPPPTRPPKPAKKRSIVPWIIGVLVVLFLGVAGLGVAGYIFRGEIREFLKTRLESKNTPTPTPANENSNANSSTNANTNSNSGNANSSGNTNNETKKEPAAFVPPADAVQFNNSKDNLDGDLAEHYIGFSFYYPKTWTKDPKAGVAGASNFAKVDRQFSDNTGEFIQERALFNWYPSKGTYEADVPGFPEYAKKFTDQLKSLQNYEEVSRGETTVNAYKGYEVRFKGEFKKDSKSLPYWGRVILLPPGAQNEKAGVAIVMLATSYAPGVTSAEDVGVKGELALILDSFRLVPKP